MVDQPEDLCIHEMTTAFCSLCKQTSRRRERLARARRHAVEDDWGTSDHPSMPFPSTKAEYNGRCHSCDDPYTIGERIFRADGGWCCVLCADVFKDLGVGADG